MRSFTDYFPIKDALNKQLISDSEMILNKLFLALGLAVLYKTFAEQEDANYEIENGIESLESMEIKLQEIENSELKVIQPITEFSRNEANLIWILTLNENDSIKNTVKIKGKEFQIVVSENRGMRVFANETPITKLTFSANVGNKRTWLVLLLCLLNLSPIIYRVNLRSKIPFIFALLVLFLDFSNGAQRYAKETGVLCNNGRGKIIAIGVETSSALGTSYTVQIIVCFDPVTHRTFWAKHFLDHTQQGTNRPPPAWARDFLGVNLNAEYQNFSSNENFSSDRGHLAANADFDGREERRATDYLINTAPQCYKLNRGCWARIEKLVRSLANNQTDRLLVVTGAAGNRFTFFRSNDFEYPYPEEFFKIVVFSNGNMQIYVRNNDNTAVCVTNITQFTPQLRQRWGLENSDTNYQEARRQFARVHQHIVEYDELKKK